MHGYGSIHLSLSDCVHFVRNEELGGDWLKGLPAELKKSGIQWGYADYLLNRAKYGVVTELANRLELQNRPYGDRPWVPFLDDLITLSSCSNGLVIVVDNADVFLQEARNDFFDLTDEAFLIQFHHWLEKKKPCHLCFQMEANELIKNDLLEIVRRMG